MVLRIEADTSDHTTTLRLIGRLQSEDLVELRRQLERGGTRVVLDLKEVTLVDAASVQFLVACDSDGVELRHGSPYVLAWIARERSRRG
jgi:anti-anti-sigma regulatory factor